MNLKCAYRSCFIVDVKVFDTEIELEDTGHQHYVIDKSNEIAMSSFKHWFKDVFIAGISQAKTIFSYVIRKEKETGIAEIVITKFVNQSKKDEIAV